MIKNEELRQIIIKAGRGTYSASEAMDMIELLCRHLIQINLQINHDLEVGE